MCGAERCSRPWRLTAACAMANTHSFMERYGKTTAKYSKCTKMHKLSSHMHRQDLKLRMVGPHGRLPSDYERSQQWHGRTQVHNRPQVSTSQFSPVQRHVGIGQIASNGWPEVPTVHRLRRKPGSIVGFDKRVYRATIQNLRP